MLTHTSEIYIDGYEDPVVVTESKYKNESLTAAYSVFESAGFDASAITVIKTKTGDSLDRWHGPRIRIDRTVFYDTRRISSTGDSHE